MDIKKAIGNRYLCGRSNWRRYAQHQRWNCRRGSFRSGVSRLRKAQPLMQGAASWRAAYLRSSWASWAIFKCHFALKPATIIPPSQCQPFYLVAGLIPLLDLGRQEGSYTGGTS